VPVVGGEGCYTWGRTQTSVLPLLRLSATGTLQICAPEQSRNVRYRDLERSVDCPYAAGAFGFLIFSQTFDGPDLYGASSFFKTMPPSR
jgi:hypothetical protein